MKFLIAFFLSLWPAFQSYSQQLVLPGTHPDPSVVKIGATYWASATSSNWLPAFPLLYSTDLVTWEQKGYIFNKMPDWADYYMWAPEITYDKGKVYVYYTAHKKNGNLCVGVASADKPEGPYKDHGPLVCEELGSIDAFPIRDRNGKLYLVWKEDANSVGEPTPIRACEMNEERTALIGEKKELFRNDAPWEKSLVEGVSILRHNDYFYALYAAAGCCGSGCSYVSGVARAKNLLGPWEKYEKNPVLIDSENWICKGHGTAIEKDGKYYFLYHAYDKKTSAFTGRQGLLQEFNFTPDNWINFINTKNDTVSQVKVVTDEFKGNKLNDIWQWSVFEDINYKMKDGELRLSALHGPSGSFIGQKILSDNYTATTLIKANQSTASAGIAAIGDDDNIVSVFLRNNQLEILKVRGGLESIMGIYEIPRGDSVFLQMWVRDRYRISFLYSLDGKDFKPLNETPVKATFLPPWDNPPRAGLISRGNLNEQAVFEKFILRQNVTIFTGKITFVTRKSILLSVAFMLPALVLLFIGLMYLKKTRRKKRAVKPGEKVSIPV
ncbi:MAG: xylB [Segetibacter sp.]|nr:xylB [Segetibacter sp.]